MIIIEKRKFTGIALASFLLILLTAIWAYKIGMRATLKADSELVLFLGFIGAALELFLFIIILIYTRKKENDFLMLTKTIQLNGVISEARAKKLGNLGIALQEALDDAYRITAQKSVKIAGLNGLVAELFKMIDRPVLAVNLAGEILEFSPKAQSDTGCKKGVSLDQIAPNVSMKEAFQEAVRTHSAVQQGDHVVCVPVFSATDTLSFFLIDLSQQPTVTRVMENFKHLIQKEEPEKKHKGSFFKLFKK